MYVAEDLVKLTSPPSFNEFDLSSLTDYYLKFLCKHTFTYFCSDKSGHIHGLTLSFTPSNFAHLSGIDKCVPSKYGALDIFKNINDKHWDKKDIKRFDSSRGNSNFKNAKKRLRYLTLVYGILREPKVIRFNPDLVVPKTKIKSDYLITKSIEDTYIYLGIGKDDKNNETLFPRTLLIEMSDKFIDGQIEYKVDKVIIKDKSEYGYDSALDEVAADIDIDEEECKNTETIHHIN